MHIYKISIILSSSRIILVNDVQIFAFLLYPCYVRIDGNNGTVCLFNIKAKGWALIRGNSVIGSQLSWCYTRRFTKTIFSATQSCSIVATLFRIITTLFQRFQMLKMFQFEQVDSFHPKTVVSHLKQKKNDWHRMFVMIFQVSADEEMGK